MFEEWASSLACLSSSMSESTLSNFLIRDLISVCILVLSISVSFLCSRARCFSTSVFLIIAVRQLRQVVRHLISYSCHCLFEPSKLSSGLGDPCSADRLIINRRQVGLNLFCALTCAVGYAWQVLEFDGFKVARERFICLLEYFHSGAIQAFP